MPKFRILSGVWFDPVLNETFYAGDVVESTGDLTKAQANRHQFARVSDSTRTTSSRGPKLEVEFEGGEPQVMDETGGADNSGHGDQSVSPQEDQSGPTNPEWAQTRVDDESSGLTSHVVNALLRHSPPLDTLGKVQAEYESAGTLTHVDGIGKSSEVMVLEAIKSCKV